MAINFIFARMQATLHNKGYYSRRVSMIAYVNDEKLTKVDTVSGLTITFVRDGEFLYIYIFFFA